VFAEGGRTSCKLQLCINSNQELKEAKPRISRRDEMLVAELSCVVCSGAQDFFLFVVLGFQYVAQ